MVPANTFGEVFLYQGNEYVFFAQDLELGIVYAGRIFDKELTKTLEKVIATKSRQGLDLSNARQYSYVVLDSEDYEKRAVNCGSSELNTSGKYQATLDSTDFDKIKEEINNGPAPKALKNLVKLLS